MHGEGDALQTGLVALGCFVHLHLEPTRLRPAQVHAQEHLGPVLALGATGAWVDADDGVADVEFSIEQPLLLEQGEHSADLRVEQLQFARDLGLQALTRGFLSRDLQQNLHIVELREERAMRVQLVLARLYWVEIF